MARARHRAAASPATTASATCSCRATRTCARSHRRDHRARRSQDEGLTLLGWRDVPVDNSSLSRRRRSRPTEPVHRQVFIGRATPHRRRGRVRAPALSSLRKVISNAHLRSQATSATTASTPCRCRARTIVYKGMFLAYQLGAYYKDLHDPRFESGAGAGAPALLDQHLPVLEAGASLPDGRPQRRDQHAARQRQLDGGAPGLGRFRRCSATTSRSCGRSPMRASRTPPASTTRSSSWSRAATRSRTP